MNNAHKFIVIADDFTGANDTGVQFTKAGFKVNVVINTGRLIEEVEQCDVLVIDLESRLDSQEVAYDKSFSLGRLLAKMENLTIYKKLDSTLRGNIGAEIDGLMDALEIGIAFVTPALPVNGRTTENGEVYVHGVKLAETEAAYDPRTPVKHSRIADIIGIQSKRTCHQISTDFFKKTYAERNDYLAREINKGSQIFIFDSRDENDLANVTLTIENFKSPSLIVGSAGLANHLTKTFLKFQKRLAFVFSGSVSEKSRDQVKYAIEQSNCKLIFLDGEKLLNDSYNPDEIIKVVSAGIASESNRFIFASAIVREDVEKVFSFAKQQGIQKALAAAKIALSIGRLAATLIETFHPYAVLLTGGETAINTVNALNATGIHINGEILPGIQSGILTGCLIRSVIATKAGGFGERDAISKTLEFLKV